MSSDSMFHLLVSLRSLHILVAVLWVGTAAFISLFLVPSLGSVAPDVIARLARRNFHRFMPAVAATTILSGLLLYWHLTNGFSADGMRSHAGIVFGLGGILGVAAAIVGGGVVGKSAARIAELAGPADSLDRARGDDTTAAIEQLRRRMAAAGKVVVALMIGALVLMTLGHSV